jgi:threonine synthase
MDLVSTRTDSVRATFRSAVFRGLAPDGGLYHPVQRYQLSDLFTSLSGSSFRETAYELSRALLSDEFSDAHLQSIVERAFPFAPATSALTDRTWLLELFHGPSSAFKDFGASFLARVMELLASDWDRPPIILTATSGDTGSAVAQAFHGIENIRVVILYPSGRVSPLQEKQLTTLGDNVVALEIQGSFDDCQRLVKEAFLDPRLDRRLRLTSANSINIGRLLPQSFYYAHAFAELRSRGVDSPLFCVPSGNFGNLTAGVFCHHWGMPASGYIAATNANDVVPEYLLSGVFAPRASVQTLSNAMDVGNPSNFERLSRIYTDDVDEMRADIRGYSVTDNETIATMRRYHSQRGVFLDPHTATGVFATERLRADGIAAATPVVCLATAHPGKFIEVVQQATGKTPEIPERLRELLDREKRAVLLDSAFSSLQDFLLDTYST